MLKPELIFDDFLGLSNGVYLQPDPIRYASGDINLYRYCKNNPLNWTDPLGLFVFGKRPLENMPWILGASDNPVDDYFNTEISHEQGFFEDGSGENIGFGDKGRINNEDPSRYRFDNIHYEDDLMRDAINNIQDGIYSNLPWKKNNCQDWADRLRREYERIKNLRDQKGGCKK